MNQWNADPVTILTWNSAAGDFEGRYAKYIPGRKWVSEADWAVTPGVCEQDLAIDPIVFPGDVFVLGSAGNTSQSGWSHPNDYWLPDQMDIDFDNNPWGEDITGTRIGKVWSNGSWFMWKILNDSVRDGTKPANDPEDFELLEAWARAEGGDWVIGGRTANADNQTVTWIRRPEIWHGNPVVGGSFGNTVANYNEDGSANKYADGSSEWLTYDRNYGILQGYGWPDDILYITRISDSIICMKLQLINQLYCLNFTKLVKASQ
jgi:hypothetical protein